MMSAEDAIDRVCKWRTVFAGRVWGTSLKTPQTKGRTDIFERLIILRVECNAFAGLLLRKGLITEAEWIEALRDEAIALDAAYAATFPGIESTPHGMKLDQRAVETMAGWPA